MKIAVMQPYFFPYIGYFQLINAVDEFVIYDNIKYTKKGWINRNRILVNGKDSYISIPLKNDSDYLDIKDRYIAESWYTEKKKILNKITGAYNKAPNFGLVYKVIESCFSCEENNLFRFIYNSIRMINNYLEIKTHFTVSSDIIMDHELKAEMKVIEICRQKKAGTYINPIGGVELYDKKNFKSEGIDLHFIKPGSIQYQQLNNDFIPWLSIIDVMMWNSKEQIQSYLNEFELI